MTHPAFCKLPIETERLLLREFTAGDVDELHEILRQPDVMEYLPEDVKSREETVAIISRLRRLYGENGPDNLKKWTLAVVERSSGKIVGSCGLEPLDFEPSSVELSFAFHTNSWGRGYAAESAHGMIRYAFDHLGLERLVAVTKPGNRRSIRVLEKVNFRLEKTVSGLSEEFAEAEGDLYFSLSRDES